MLLLFRRKKDWLKWTLLLVILALGFTTVLLFVDTPSGLVTGVEAVRGGLAREIDLKPGEKWTQKHYVEMNLRYQRQTIEQLEKLASGDAPFFLQYWPLWPLNFVNDQEQNESLNGGHFAEKMQKLDYVDIPR